MKSLVCVFSFAALIGACSLALAADQPIAAGLTYAWNGEHLHIESCNIRDLSDNSTCMVAHLDHMRPNGFPTYTNEARGALKTLVPTCQAGAQSVAKAQAAQRMEIS